MSKILVVFGTRPEAIKLACLVHQLRSTGRHSVHVCVTAQHRDMLDQALAVFKLTPDFDLNVMQAGQTLLQATSRILSGLDAVLNELRPALTIVQGDTTTTLCGALASFYHGIPVAHVEAGLRTHDLKQPFPEEMNRVVTGRLTAVHFAATQWAASNLEAEGFPRESIHITGNTGIDALLSISRQLESGALNTTGSLPPIDESKKLILITAHRRENFGAPLQSIGAAMRRIAARGDVQIICPVHPNPNVRGVMHSLLDDVPNCTLIDPVDYVPFVDLMRRAHLLITDSGGVQEEGPSLGKPVLVMRDRTERPEAVEAGTVRLVGTDTERIVTETFRLLNDAELYNSMARSHNPYGDGHASERITRILDEWL